MGFLPQGLAGLMAKKKDDTGANLGFEAKLWLAADGMRNNMRAEARDETISRVPCYDIGCKRRYEECDPLKLGGTEVWRVRRVN